jgi:hypothetical protein
VKRSAPIKRGKGISPASKEQRDKVRDRCCLGCGRDRTQAKIDPAHLWPRGMGGCDDADCVVPLCRQCHRLFDDHKLDLLPFLIAAGYWTELAHPTGAHEVSPTILLERLTGQRYMPVDMHLESPPQRTEAAAAVSGRSTA